MKQLLSLLVRDQAGVLNRISGLFLRRGYNIDSITVGKSERPGLSRMTIVLDVEDEKAAEQVKKQLNKQIDVIKVVDLTHRSVVARELALIRVNATMAERAEIDHIIQPFRARILDVGRASVTVEVTGSSEKIDALIELLRPYGIKELARTGLTAFARELDVSAEAEAKSATGA
ncbi:acetolactate synthase small subunit [Hydrogenibacillus schlegelii]|uniref:Acetolactate synthase small subunit n=1 Tax=Hydrogenibacillus schlegelii TaxID=1484 RepID=A0A132MH88_HYDSH|nr:MULTISPECIES: acetolactate synthase small subunit [Hydrogenibacillus]KWW97212.1 acetolactate synthase [Hydrogenibacillus schlegelii]MBE3563473.1 acetolactate synthase small subunit [Hydrogenibacillus schlegelii]MBT9283040.1 acetolactate synthase small subunit [Hydrogenibacillus schlegelii]OAR05382.1 acetolactate synthase small subunit [Hydrogenibacillus schlegelii]PTQ54418.1 MAG: Acetolactate synthase small subunit [Hydrogenibacillus schlegelii]